MKKKKVLISIISVLLVIEGISLFLTYKSYNNLTSKVLENVKTINIFDNKDKTLSIMLQEDGINFTEAKDRNAWPDIKKYTYDKAECTDSTGATVDYKTILTFNYDSATPTTTIKTNKTVYCTLYFVKGRDTLTLLKEKGGATFQDKSGMWRFVGATSAVKNNYICFGTTDTSLCTSQPDKYMYRIIGMTKTADTTLGLDANRLKIIKATPLSELKQWYSSNKDGNWNNSELNSYLKTTFYTDAKTTKWQTGTYWDGLITSQKWYMELKAEYPWPSTNPLPNTISEGLADGKVGLMYASDYYNSGSQDTNNWLYVKNGWSTSSSLSGNFIYEWTMSRYGNYYGDYAAWYVTNSGTLSDDYVNYTFAVRPVFYLKSNVMLSGTGTTSDPFRIAA